MATFNMTKLFNSNNSIRILADGKDLGIVPKNEIIVIDNNTLDWDGALLVYSAPGADENTYKMSCPELPDEEFILKVGA